VGVHALPLSNPTVASPSWDTYVDAYLLETIGPPFSSAHVLLSAQGKFSSFSKYNTAEDVCGDDCLSWGAVTSLKPVNRYMPHATCDPREIPDASPGEQILVLSMKPDSKCTAWFVGNMAQSKGYRGVVLALPDCTQKHENGVAVCNTEDFMSLHPNRGDPVPSKATLIIPFVVYNAEDVRYMLMEQNKYMMSHIYAKIMTADPNALPSISQRLITMMMAAPLFMFAALCLTRMVRQTMWQRDARRRQGRSAARRAEQMTNMISSMPEFAYKTLSERPDGESLADADMCSICLGGLEPEETVRKLACTCKYLYHKECIDPWLVESAACPVCKKSFISEPEEEEEDSDDSELDSDDDVPLLNDGSSGGSGSIYEDDVEDSSSEESDDESDVSSLIDGP